ncbi:MAG TPA: hypothetical protein VMG10_00415 [Gemmataceae bacterium]|nr:hypothetical protein [Gemmataceae bacterium]
MARKNTSDDESSFFNLAHARWVVGVLGMLIAVVGKESLVGLLLRQTRREIDSLIEDEQPAPSVERANRYKYN